MGETGINKIVENIVKGWRWLKSEIGRGSWVAGLVIVVVGVLVYSNTLNASWHFDDYDNIVNNPYVHDWKWFRDSLNWKTGRMVGNVTFLLNYQTDGDKVLGYHLVNITIHLLAGLVVWRLVGEIGRINKTKRKWGVKKLEIGNRKGKLERGRTDDDMAVGANWVGLVAGLLFVVHPVQTQAVTYIVQRYASLAGLFYVLAVWAYVKVRLAKTRRRVWGWGVVVVGAGGLGLLTKETVATLPLMLLVVEGYWFSRSVRDWLAKALILAGVGLVGAVIIVQQVGLGYILYDTKETGLKETVTWGSYVLTQFRVLLKYIQLMVVPVRQNLDYTFPLSYGWDGGVVLGLVVLVGLVGLTWWWYRRWKLGSFAIGWFLVGLMVTSLIPIQDVIFDHRLYISVAGWAVLMAGWLYQKWGKDKEVLVVMVVMVVGVYGVWGYARNRVWATELSLWQDVVSKSPNKARAVNQYAVQLQQAGRIGEAVENYRKVMELEPTNADVHYNMGQALVALGRGDEAIGEFTKAVEINPKITRAYNYIGLVLADKGKYKEALENIDKAIAGEPEVSKLYRSRGMVLVALGRKSEAEKAFAMAESIDETRP